MRCSLLVPLCAIVSACSFDLTPVSAPPPANQSEQASFAVWITSMSNGVADVGADLFVGRLYDGSFRLLANDSLRVNDRSYAPVEYKDGLYRYRLTAAVAEPVLDIESPQFAIEQRRYPVTVSVPRITPGDSIIVRRGDNIVVAVEGLVPSDLTFNWNWQLGLQSFGNGESTTVTQSGRIGPVLQFPAALIPDGMVRGVLSVHTFAFQEYPSGNNFISIRVQRQLHREIVVRIISDQADAASHGDE